jgi:hypothetical protein
MALSGIPAKHRASPLPSTEDSKLNVMDLPDAKGDILYFVTNVKRDIFHFVTKYRLVTGGHSSYGDDMTI